MKKKIFVMNIFIYFYFHEITLTIKFIIIKKYVNINYKTNYGLNILLMT